MSNNKQQQTLAIVKPDGIKSGLAGKIITHIQQKGFQIIAMKQCYLTQKQAKGFYQVHYKRHFFDELCTFMSSGPCIPIILKKISAVRDFRLLIGATDPAQAEKGTIRQLYATSLEQNVIHGSDSEENAIVECAYFFAKIEINTFN